MSSTGSKILKTGKVIEGIHFPAPSVAFVIWLGKRYKEDLTDEKKFTALLADKPEEGLRIVWAIFNQNRLGTYIDDPEEEMSEVLRWASEISLDLWEKYMRAIPLWIADFFAKSPEAVGSPGSG
ncbi:MAG: hypothetical protein DRP08_06880 [Candidatus Aenigmatarchaeota archaeon]|nr:MAG: hypothetical protein DRP08_06880 [Candidatus Aenigmarchaeota archaeon]